MTRLIYGRHVVCDAERTVPSGAVVVEDGVIREVGSYADLAARHRPDEVIGSEEMLVTPGLVNAHGHGKGITDFQRGALDDTLETWRLRRFPRVDLRWDTLWTALRLLENGVTATMHSHNLIDPGAAEEELVTVLEAYREAGVRVALAPPLQDRNLFVYGREERFIAGLPEDLAAYCREGLKRAALFAPQRYFRTVDSLQRRYRSDSVRLLQGPLGPQWVSDEALRECARQAEELDQRIHIHLLQTRLQMLFARREYGASPVEHLAKLGFLSPRVTCGHAVWLSEADIRLLAETGSSVTHHPACNLRVRNGIAPVEPLLRHGVKVAVGMDEKELGDDKDYLEELRLAARLHRVASDRLDSPHLLPRELLRMGTEWGAELLGFGALAGRLAPGLRADLVLFGLKRMSAPFTLPGHDPVDLLLYRGRGLDVDTVMVNGEVLLREGRLTGLDREEVARRLRESLPEDYEGVYRRVNEPAARLRRHVAAHYASWQEELERSAARPFYLVNRR